MQIGKEIKRFAKAVSLSCVCVYGGSGVANQITELKRGTEIVVCTPGRMIDLLVTSAGKITNLRRVTYLVSVLVDVGIVVVWNDVALALRARGLL